MLENSFQRDGQTIRRWGRALRSRNGEALAVAGKLQGGGHPDAAGATLPRNIRSIPDALDYLRRRFG